LGSAIAVWVGHLSAMFQRELKVGKPALPLMGPFDAFEFSVQTSIYRNLSRTSRWKLLIVSQLYSSPSTMVFYKHSAKIVAFQKIDGATMCFPSVLFFTNVALPVARALCADRMRQYADITTLHKWLASDNFTEQVRPLVTEFARRTFGDNMDEEDFDSVCELVLLSIMRAFAKTVVKDRAAILIAQERRASKAAVPTSAFTVVPAAPLIGTITIAKTAAANGKTKRERDQ